MTRFAPYFFAVCLLYTSIITAQSFNFETGYGSYNTLDHLLSLENDRWLAVYTTSSEPGALYHDTVFAIVFDPALNVVFKKILPLLPSESYRVWDAVATPDGGFIIGTGRNLCDALRSYTLLAFDMNGSQKWVKQFSSKVESIKVVSGQGLIIIDNDLKIGNYT